MRQKLQEATGNRNNSKEGKNGKERRKDEHRKQNLTRHQKKLKKKALQFLKSGNAIAASQLLESIGMLREAIDVLEASGRVGDAAKVLMRIGKHDRAGVMFARHARWEQAAECYQLARMPFEVAKCYREAGKFLEAAEFFIKIDKFLEAAECYIKLQKYDKAASLYIQAKMPDLAIQSFKKLSNNPDARFNFSRAEVEIIHNYIKEGNLDPDLAQALATNGRLNELIFYFIDKDEFDAAATLYKCDPSHPAPQLVSEVAYHTNQAAGLAKVFQIVNEPKYAGIVLERLDRFEEAGAEFENAQDYVRASDCYIRAGNTEKVKALKILMEKMPLESSIGRSKKFALGIEEKQSDDNSDDESIEDIKEDDNSKPQFVDAPKIEPEKPAPPKFSLEDDSPLDMNISPQQNNSNSSQNAQSNGGAFSLEFIESEEENTVVTNTEFTPENKLENNEGYALSIDLDVSQWDLQAQNIQETNSYEKYGEILKKMPFFKLVTDDFFKSLFQAGEIKVYEAGQIIFFDDNQGVYILLQGSVKLEPKNNVKLENDRALSPLFLNLSNAFFSKPTYLTYVALERSCALYITQQAFDQQLQSDGKMCHLLYRRLVGAA